jgi:hypothetical protein
VSSAKKFARKTPVLEVVWSDCQFLGLTGWEAYENVMRDRSKILQRTVGYVLADDKKGIMLTGTLSQFGNVYGTVNIPRSQIKKVRRLR